MRYGGAQATGAPCVAASIFARPRGSQQTDPVADVGQATVPDLGIEVDDELATIGAYAPTEPPAALKSSVFKD